MQRLMIKLRSSITRAGMMFAIFCSSYTYSQLGYAKLIAYLDIQMDNDTEFTLSKIDSLGGSKGNLSYLNKNNIQPYSGIELANFTANYLGQLSQDLSFEIIDQVNNKNIGICNLHVGIGSYLALPDFSSSRCRLTSSEYVQLNPRYEVINDVYKVHFNLSRSKQFSRIFIFGDSMSDNGNLYRRSLEIPISPILPMSPPYYSGRFTNGKVWIERLSEKLNIPQGSLIDYAYAGATVVPDLFPIPNLEKQVSTYINWNETADSYALYAVWIGSNDIIRHNKKNEQDLLNEISQGIESNIRRLIDHGAKNILSLPIPDVTLTPDIIRKDQSHGNTQYSERLSGLIKKYNKKHNEFIAKLRQEYPDVKIMNFDVYSFIQNAKQRAKEYGFTNLVDPCNKNEYWSNDLEICKIPNEYVYWDGVHPSAKVHGILAELVFKFVTDAGFEPNNKLLANRSQMDDVAMRNKIAVEQLSKNIDSPVNSQGSYESNRAISGINWTNDLSSIIENRVQLF